jgi:hypothetical protein
MFGWGDGARKRSIEAIATGLPVKLEDVHPVEACIIAMLANSDLASVGIREPSLLSDPRSAPLSSLRMSLDSFLSVRRDLVATRDENPSSYLGKHAGLHAMGIELALLTLGWAMVPQIGRELGRCWATTRLHRSRARDAVAWIRKHEAKTKVAAIPPLLGKPPSDAELAVRASDYPAFMHHRGN